MKIKKVRICTRETGTCWTISLYLQTYWMIKDFDAPINKDLYFTKNGWNLKIEMGKFLQTEPTADQIITVELATISQYILHFNGKITNQYRYIYFV